MLADLVVTLATSVGHDPSRPECWPWIGRRVDGYAHTEEWGYVHRAVYTYWHGPIPPGYVVDHVCMYRDCVSPTHLEAVTWTENNQRAARHYRVLREDWVRTVRNLTVWYGMSYFALGWRHLSHNILICPSMSGFGANCLGLARIARNVGLARVGPLPRVSNFSKISTRDEIEK